MPDTAPAPLTRAQRRQAERLARREAEAHPNPTSGWGRAARRQTFGPRPTDTTLIVHGPHPMPVRPSRRSRNLIFQPGDGPEIPVSGRARRDAKRAQRTAFWASFTPRNPHAPEATTS